MKLSHWNLIIAMRSDIVRLLERTLAVDNTRFGERSSALPVDLGTLQRLQVELRTKLDALRDNLNRELVENETYLVMFPLVLLCDEMVMSRLAKEQQTRWSLLQSELFEINYGGDVFYDFVDERLDKPDTPGMVYEVLYFCLAAGFVGKFGESSGKVQRYRTLLSEQVGSLSPAERRRRRRAARAKRSGLGEKGARRERSADKERSLAPLTRAAGNEREPGLSAGPTRGSTVELRPMRRVNWGTLAPYLVALAILGVALSAVVLFSNL